MQERMIEERGEISPKSIDYVDSPESIVTDPASELPLVDKQLKDFYDADLKGLVALKDVKNQVRIEDPVFEERVSEFGQEYIEYFLDATSLVMGHEKVRAYVLHDIKEESMVESFANVEKHFLPGLPESEVREHLQGIVEVLKIHDLVEDGPEAASEEYEDFDYENLRVDSEIALTDDVWLEAYELAENYAEGVGVEGETEKDFISAVEHVEDPNAFAAPHVECYAVHTQLFERPDELGNFSEFWRSEMRGYEIPEIIERDLQDQEEWQELDFVAQKATGYMAEMAFESRKVLYSNFSGLPSEDKRNKSNSIGFVRSIFSHDRHSPDEQIENIFRMAKVYSEILENRV